MKLPEIRKDWRAVHEAIYAIGMGKAIDIMTFSDRRGILISTLNNLAKQCKVQVEVPSDQAEGIKDLACEIPVQFVFTGIGVPKITTGKRKKKTGS